MYNIPKLKTEPKSRIRRRNSMCSVFCCSEKENKMLRVSKTTNLNGTSNIGTEIAATMYATVSEDGSINIGTNASNTELAAKNKETVRNDIAAFQEAAYKVQDEIQKEIKSEEV